MKLQDIPNEILLEILKHFETARDVARLAASSQKLHQLIEEEGWRVFVKTRFPSLTIPTNDDTSWNAVADAVTWQVRCWDRRAFQVTSFTHSQYHRPPFAPGANLYQSAPFQPAIDAHLTKTLTEELVVWGAGEDITAQFMPAKGSKKATSWFSLEGREHGYSAGLGDVTAVSIADTGEDLGIIVGRANGHLHLLSGDKEKFGTVVSEFAAPIGESSTSEQSKSGTIVKTAKAISTIDVQPGHRNMVVGRKSAINIYSLTDNGSDSILPTLSYDLMKELPSSQSNLEFLNDVKFVGQDTLVVGLAKSLEPLRWAKIKPTGMELFTASKSSALISRMELADRVRTTVRSVQPVYTPSGPAENLILSAWEDGTCR
jgi:hypothetical protein